MGGRLIGLCEASHLAVEASLKAVGTLTGVQAKLLHQHDVETIADALPREERDAMLALMATAPGLVKTPGYITMWRTKGTYTSPTGGMTAQEIATPPRWSASQWRWPRQPWTGHPPRDPAPSLRYFTTAAEQIRNHITTTDLASGEAPREGENGRQLAHHP